MSCTQRREVAKKVGTQAQVGPALFAGRNHVRRAPPYLLVLRALRIFVVKSLQAMRAWKISENSRSAPRFGDRFSRSYVTVGEFQLFPWSTERKKTTEHAEARSVKQARDARLQSQTSSRTVSRQPAASGIFCPAWRGCGVLQDRIAEAAAARAMGLGNRAPDYPRVAHDARPRDCVATFAPYIFVQAKLPY